MSGINLKETLKVGFVSVWFERGQAYVTKMIRDSIADQCQAHVFARTGGVYGQWKLETKGFWQVPCLTTHPDYDIPAPVLIQWINENSLDVVIFNEEYDFGLVKTIKQTGVKVVTYLDYYQEDWSEVIRLYDLVLCSNMRTYNLVKDLCPALYMGWAVDTGLFNLRDFGQAQYTFFHNAGWLGINFRKMTPACLLAFDAISRHLPEITLLVHAQAGLDLLPPQAQEIIRNNPRITYRIATIPAPGLYHMGEVMVFPTKLEGLGLPLFEAMACGLPVVSTDAPPMNEFVRHGYNGLLVPVATRVTREDNIAYPEEVIDVNQLALTMADLAQNPEKLHLMGKNARRYAEDELRMDRLGEKVMRGLASICGKERA
jgi:1,2-diacylglycerol 3-alpha-glucosyltransferase